MLSKWKKSACAETAQSSRRKHRADIANRLTWSGPNDTEHEVPFLLSHLSERGGPPAACLDWDTPPRPRQRLPAEAKEGRLLCGSLRAGGGAVNTLTSNLIEAILMGAKPVLQRHATEITRGLRVHKQPTVSNAN